MLDGQSNNFRHFLHNVSHNYVCSKSDINDLYMCTQLDGVGKLTMFAAECFIVAPQNDAKPKRVNQ